MIFNHLAGIENVALFVPPLVHIDYRRTAVGQKSCLSIGRKAVEFDPDEYQKF